MKKLLNNPSNLTKKDKYLLFLIAIATIIVYFNSFQNPFIWDQEAVIVGNPLIRSWSNLPEVFTTDMLSGKMSSSGFYRPMEIVTYIFDYSIWELNVFGYHITTTLLHILTTFIIFFLMLKLNIKKTTSFLISFLFAIHPINNEAVVYSVRGDILATLFSLLTFLFFLNFLKSSKTKHIVISIIIYIFALFSKEWVVITPFIILLYLIIENNLLNNPKNSLKAPNIYVAPLILISLIYFFLRAFSIFGSNERPLALIVDAPLWQKLLTFPRTLLTYLRLMVFPINLHMEYMFVVKSLTDPYVLFGIPALTTIIYLLIKFSKYDQKKLLFFGGWFFAGLFPFLNIFIPIHATLAEHWAYFASLGLIAYACILLSYIYDKLQNKIAKKSMIAGLVAVSLIFSGIIMKRNWEWADPMRLYKHDLALEPNSFVLNNNVGVVYFRNGNLQEAKKYFANAVAVSPGRKYDVAMNNLGVIYQNEGNIEKAADLYKKSIEANNYKLAYENLGKIYLKQKKIDDFVKISMEGTQHYPYSPELQYNLGLGLFIKKDYKRALIVFEFIHNTLHPNYNNTAEILYELYQMGIDK